MQWLVFLIAIAAGAANPFQSGTNAELQSHWEQSLWSTAWVYLSGFAGILLIQVFARQPLPKSAAVHAAPWWAWMGGLISIAATMAGVTLAHKLGSGVFVGLTLTASVIVSTVLDHMGWIGFKHHPASPQRIAGGVLMVLGVWLVSRF